LLSSEESARAETWRALSSKEKDVLRRDWTGFLLIMLNENNIVNNDI
jgi:hypothetical protein